ncbi:Small integral membrane protein 13 [Portunus trituberculatus]|uniref:Small integral membrane protein 13 n=1 Tax=Portunus trituberculatus TaxID=210409 RepID=A0A5B7CY94_PORTR|nr:Small integral membrane protein 13 [Portunus trituberculatus]
MEGRDLAVGVVTVVVSLACLVAFVALGWYAVWRLFLSRFSFVRELFGNQQEGGSSGVAGEETNRPSRPRASRKIRRD